MAAAITILSLGKIRVDPTGTLTEDRGPSGFAASEPAPVPDEE